MKKEKKYTGIKKSRRNTWGNEKGGEKWKSRRKERIKESEMVRGGG
jgi:hypothetical protein